jgi:transketolase
MSTRVASGIIMNDINKSIPNFFGGSADLSHSNMTYLENANDFHINPKGHNI